MDEMTDLEQEQLKKFETFRRLVQAIVLRRFWIPLLAAALVFVGLYAFLYARALKSDRFESRAVLLFHPRESEHIRPMDQKELFQILFRRSLKEKLATTLRGADAPDWFRQMLLRTVEFSKDDHQPNVFNVIVRASSAEAAIERANAFAQLCLQEYASYRNADLKRWAETAETRRKELTERLVALDKEEDELAENTRLPQPRQELDRLNESLKQQKLALADATIRLTKETSQLKNLRRDLGEIPPSVVDHVEDLKHYIAAFEKIEAEIAEAEALYTEKNPRLIVVRERRANLQAKYEAFCRLYGIGTVDFTILSRVETLENSIKEAETRVDVARETCEALKREIANGAQDIAKLQEIIPNYDRIRRRRETVQQSLTEIEDNVSDIQYLKASVETDFSLIEPVNSAEETVPMSKKKLILILMASVVAGGGFSLFVVLIEILFGRVYDLREVSYYPELQPLGSLPPVGRTFSSEADEKRVLDRIYYKFHTAAENVRTMFVGRLPGGEFSKRLHDELDWNCAMGGRRLLRVEVVSAMDFEVTDKMSAMGGLVLQGRNQAFFPVGDISRFSPGEMMLLENDIKELEEKYDFFVIGRRVQLSNESIFFEQMLSFCDCSTIFVGSRRTSRQALRRAIQRQKRSGKAMFVVVSDERNMEIVEKGV